MKGKLALNRSKYIFTLVIVSLVIGVIFQKVISYPRECSPVNNERMTYLFKI